MSRRRSMAFSRERRRFLKQSGQAALMASAFDQIFLTLLQGRLAEAQTASSQFKQFLHINFYGSPPRWMYDLFLNPGNSSLFMPSPMVANVLKATTSRPEYTETGYELIRVTKGSQAFHVPYLFGQQVQVGNRGLRSVHEILNNMLNIRGIDVVNAAHDGANELHQCAVPGEHTISSLTADRAERPATSPTTNMIRAMTINPTPGSIFKGRQPGSPFLHSVSSAGVNELNTLFQRMRPLSTASGFPSRFVANHRLLQDELDQALAALTPEADAYLSSLNSSARSAQSILRDETISLFADLTKDWTDIYGKYESAIRTTLGRTYAKINDQRIGHINDQSNATRRRYYQSGQDIFNFIRMSPTGPVDLRESMNDLDTLGYKALAASFAVTEFLMTRRLTSSIAMRPVAFNNLKVGGTTASPSARQTLAFDQHFHGTLFGTYANSMFYLAFSSGLLELIERLKEASVFNDTLIYMAAEFNRSARFDGSGADHGFEGGSVSLLSGRNTQFKVIGNILRDSGGVGSRSGIAYRGTWGQGGAINGLDQLNIIQVYGSILRLLGDSPAAIPNLVDKSKLIFNTPGSFAVASGFDTATTINNASLAGA